MIIYLSKNVINQKKYIGKTVRQLNNRKISHLSAVRKGRENVYFHNAIRKHGESSFTWEIVCECSTSKELCQKEKYYINLYKTNNPDYGYNLTNGGEGCEGYKHTQANKELMSKMKKGLFVGENNPMYGKHHSKETIIKQSELKKGENHPFWGKKRPEHSMALKGIKRPGVNKKGKDSPCFGKKHSEETKAKIREKALLRIRRRFSI